MRGLAIAALTVALTTVAARANSVIASCDYGPFGESSGSTINAITISLGVAPDTNYVGDTGTVQLLNVTIPTTATGNATYTITSSDPNWTAALALLDDGNNKFVSPIVALGNTGLTVSQTVDEFYDGYYSNIFSAPSQLTASPITSIQLDVTNLQFTKSTKGKSKGNVDGYSIDDISVTFFTGSPTVAAPLPAAFPAGSLLLTGIAATTLHRRKRRPV